MLNVGDRIKSNISSEWSAFIKETTKKPNLFALLSSSQMSSYNRISFSLSLFSVRVENWYSGSWSSDIESSSHSVMSSSLRPHVLYTVHGILQARILKWVAVPFFRRSSQPRDQTQVSCIAGRFFISWATRKPFKYWKICKY